MEYMTLKETLTQDDNSDINGVVIILTGKATMETAQGKSYLNLTVQDKSLSHAFKNFFKTEDEYAVQNANLEEGKLYQIFARVGSYNGQKQIQNARFRVIKDEDYEKYLPFVLPVYPFDSSVVTEFLNFIELHITDERYFKFVCRAFGNFDPDNRIWKDFLTAPAAKSHHGNKIHGLFYHVFKVAKNCALIANTYSQDESIPYRLTNVNMDRLMTAALLHDIMKIDEYSWEQGIKMSGKYQLGHIDRGVVYLNQVNESLDHILTDEEVDFLQYAILSHHGDFGPQKPKHIENWILHLADMVDAKIVAEIEIN